MPPLTTVVAKELVNGTRDMLRQAAVVATFSQDNYIANGDPESVYGKLQLATARQACRRYADQPDKFTGVAASLVERACRPYLADIGYGTPPSIKPPFIGGQCAVRYSVRGDRYSLATGNLVQAAQLFASNLLGPLRFESAGNAPPPGGCNPGTGTFSAGAVIRSANNLVVSINGSGCSSFHPQTRNITVTRDGGGLDSCGNPDTEVEIPRPPSMPGDPVEPFNPGPDVNIDIGVGINPDGTITVDIGTGPITIDPFADPGEGAGGGGGPPPGDIGSPGAGGVAGAGEDAEGEAPPGSVLVGLDLTLTTIPESAREYEPGVYRGVCYVYMGVPGKLDHDPAGAMIRSSQFVFAEKDNLTSWRVSSNNGYVINVIPYYREVE